MSRLESAALALVIVATAVASADAQSKKASARKKAAETHSAGRVLVVVNGDPITEKDLERALRTRQVPEDQRERVRPVFLEELIDARLVAQFLKSRKTAASKEEIDEQRRQVRELARSRGADPEQELAALGYTEEALRQEFALPLAWKHHLDRVLTPEKLQEFFKEHRAEFDGTQVRASRILVKVPADEEAAWESAQRDLEGLQARIAQGGISFDEAAREYSQAPSKEQGGDVGWFSYEGRMPREFSRAAFELKAGEISEPFRSRYGLELCLVTDRRAGELSLEDVRDDVVQKLSEELWRETTAQLRKKAKIEWKDVAERSAAQTPKDGGKRAP